ncbi:hypothetical protein [Streptosporangium subroseum]|uniref:hypothetical protein n=1 Tax=Streptosporangium subroseum TaxID=106412 RepID=UPI00308E3789|nr:hypothetical protein OHB15_13860 [Streptosporangium subroseum]
MLGPNNLNDLDAPEAILSLPGLAVDLSRGEHGTYYEITADSDTLNTVADIIAGLLLLPQDAVVRDAFNFPGGICVNFWRQAA